MSDKSGQPGAREHVVQIRRCACVVKGGRRFSFAALVVVGDGRGSVGWGYAKAPEVPQAVEKAVKSAERSLVKFELTRKGDSVSVPFEVRGKFGASKVLLLPASAGTGLIACGVVRSVLDAAGVTDCLSKVSGSSNPLNLVRACLNVLGQMQSLEDVASVRGVSL